MAVTAAGDTSDDPMTVPEYYSIAKLFDNPDLPRYTRTDRIPTPQAHPVSSTSNFLVYYKTILLNCVPDVR